MEYKAYRLRFQRGVHFGSRSLEESEYTFHADTLFSALCHEALKEGEEVLQRLYDLTAGGRLLLSDAMPYMGDELYIPKPMLCLHDEEEDLRVRKAYRKLRYIPACLLQDYLEGHLDAIKEQKRLDQLGTSFVRTMAAVRGKEGKEDGKDLTEPYRVGIVQFSGQNGLYLLVGYLEEETMSFFEDLMDRLSFAGLGGKRSSGLGRFEFDFGEIPDEMAGRLKRDGNTYMSLSVALPAEHEMEAVFQDADFQLIKRSGFVASDHYAEECRRKRDLYVMDAGACVHRRFCGGIVDVSQGGRHAVWRYAKPLLMEVDV